MASLPTRSLRGHPGSLAARLGANVTSDPDHRKRRATHNRRQLLNSLRKQPEHRPRRQIEEVAQPVGPHDRVRVYLSEGSRLGLAHLGDRSLVHVRPATYLRGWKR